MNRTDRRSFLKTAATTGVAVVAAPILNVQCTAKQQPASTGNNISNPPVITQRRTLGTGKAALEVSALGFGIMGMNYHRGASPDRKAMIKLLHQAVEHGVTLFDTAEIYGPFTNEELAGEGLYPYRDKICISTKFGRDIVNGKGTGKLNSRPETIRRVAEESLKRLGIETISLFYQHRFDPDIPIEDVAGTVKDLIREGKVKHFGLCEVGAETIRRAHAVQPVTAIQSAYHLMWREPEKEVLPVCEKLGIGFVPYCPINIGFLGGTLNEYTQFDAQNDNRAILPRFTPEALRANMRIVEALREFGQTRGATIAQIALAWLLAKAPWIVPIPGTTKLSHLEENLRTAEIVFTSEECKELENIISAIPIMGDRYPASLQQQITR